MNKISKVFIETSSFNEKLENFTYSREIRAEMEKEAIKVVLNTKLREFN